MQEDDDLMPEFPEFSDDDQDIASGIASGITSLLQDVKPTFVADIWKNVDKMTEELFSAPTPLKN